MADQLLDILPTYAVVSARRLLTWSQVDLAKATRISTEVITAYESGAEAFHERYPTFSAVEASRAIETALQANGVDCVRYGNQVAVSLSPRPVLLWKLIKPYIGADFEFGFPNEAISYEGFIPMIVLEGLEPFDRPSAEVIFDIHSKRIMCEAAKKVRLSPMSKVRIRLTKDNLPWVFCERAPQF